MNTALFKSLWIVPAGLVSVFFLGWLAASGASPGARFGSDRTLVLCSGWVAFALTVGVSAYPLRKLMHSLGAASRLARKVSRGRLESAESRLYELRAAVASGSLVNRREIQRAANGLLREEGIRRICRAVVFETDGDPGFDIGLRRTEPWGRMVRWLHFHLYAGAALVVIVYVHGGASVESPLGTLLNVLVAVVVGTGVVGALLFSVGPSLMTRRERGVGFEEASVRARMLDAKLREACVGLENEPVRMLLAADLSGHAPERAREALDQAVALDDGDPERLRDLMVLVAQRRSVVDEARALGRLRSWTRVWRLVHVPGAILLLAALLVHVYQVWRW